VAVAPPVSPLNGADRAFNAGNYDESARAYEDYLRANTAGTERDQALFKLGLSYALRPAATADWTRAEAAFKELVDAHPKSPLKPPAYLILSMRSELDQAAADGKQRDLKIKQLTTELDRLKKIDADRRKKP
jgi:outer membrane protein assembly factor BamD (BamD/ComL family)